MPIRKNSVMVSIVLARILVFVFACAQVVFYNNRRSIFNPKGDTFDLDCARTNLMTAKKTIPKAIISKTRFNTLTPLPPIVINIKGKHTQIPALARNSEQIPVRGPERVTLQEIDGFLKQRAINNDVMITICDSGYLDIYRLFYRLNKMWQYPNFVTFVLDQKGYDVTLLCCFESRFCRRKALLYFIIEMIS